MAATTPPAHASNADLIRWLYDCWNRGDFSSFRQVWTDETVERFPHKTYRGPEELAADFEEAHAAVADRHIELVSIAEQGDDVFVHWQMTGTHRRPFRGIEPTGKPLSIDGIDHFVVRDGKVVSNFVVFDQMQYARQLGMVPAEGSAADKATKAIFNARTKLRRKLRR